MPGWVGSPGAPPGPTELCGESSRLPWSRRVPVDTHLANIGSHSVFLVHDPEHTASFLADEREHLLRAFPSGFVEEAYDAVLLLAATPPGTHPSEGGPTRPLDAPDPREHYSSHDE